MKAIRIMCGIAAMTIVSGCGVSQGDYDKLALENERLTEELDECRFGAERIVVAVEKAYAEKNYVLARQNIEMLYEKHPESPKNAEFAKLLKAIDQKERALKKKHEAEEKERIRVANLNNIGMWSIRYFVDKFGDRTRDAYLTNTDRIRGQFSNTATQDSKLDVILMVDGIDDISILLYEYAGRNPVKATSQDYYAVSVQDDLGNQFELTANNTSDRLRLDPQSSHKVHNALLGGEPSSFA